MSSATRTADINVVAEGVRAEQVGIDFFGIGEHVAADLDICGCAGRSRAVRNAVLAVLGHW